jgi:hypothetical protein
VSALDDLIIKLETASEGSRRLDGEIAICLELIPRFDRSKYIDGTQFRFTAGDDGAIAVDKLLPDGRRYPEYGCLAPAHTTSLDAALTLVPEGFPYEIKARNVEGVMEYRAQLNYTKPSYAATPALALCIAALKARAAIAKATGETVAP